MDTEDGFEIRETQNVVFDEQKTSDNLCKALRSTPDADVLRGRTPTCLCLPSNGGEVIMSTCLRSNHPHQQILWIWWAVLIQQRVMQSQFGQEVPPAARSEVSSGAYRTTAIVPIASTELQCPYLRHS